MFLKIRTSPNWGSFCWRQQPGPELIKLPLWMLEDSIYKVCPGYPLVWIFNWLREYGPEPLNI
jgi:hypothetical protein